MRAAVDVMGGDHAPAVVLQGCLDAAPLLEEGDVILLVGDEKVSHAALDGADLPPDKRAQYQIIDAPQSIGMDEPPVEALRSKPNSSINVMCKLAAKGEADVVISAGNTGACVAAAQLRMRTLPGVSRPGIAILMPTFKGPVVLCDAGANPEPRPKHLQQYAMMASAFCRTMCGKENPRVGLLSIGEEPTKGTEVVIETNQILSTERQVNFIGNVEGRDLFKGVVDVVVCDGFVGNILLKFLEGLADALFREIMGGVQQQSPQMLGSVGPMMKKIQQSFDWRDYGAAPLLGVNGHCLICHGSSDARAIKSAIRAGKQLSGSGMNQKIIEAIQQGVQIAE